MAEGKKAVVSGYTDASGDPAMNEELAKQRAFAVRDALKAAGVAEDKIELKKPEQMTGSGDAAAGAPRRGGAAVALHSAPLHRARAGLSGPPSMVQARWPAPLPAGAQRDGITAPRSDAIAAEGGVTLASKRCMRCPPICTISRRT